MEPLIFLLFIFDREVVRLLPLSVNHPLLDPKRTSRRGHYWPRKQFHLLYVLLSNDQIFRHKEVDGSCGIRAAANSSLTHEGKVKMSLP